VLLLRYLGKYELGNMIRPTQGGFEGKRGIIRRRLQITEITPGQGCNARKVISEV